MACIVFSAFLMLLVLREIAAWHGVLRLKYLLTPLITMTIIILPVLSIAEEGTGFYNLFILAALLLALAADTLLMVEEVNLLESGMIFFLGGHICFAVAFSAEHSFRCWNILLILLMAFIDYRVIKKIRVKAGSLFPAVVLYIFSINTMLYFALTGLNQGFTVRSVCVASGAALFGLSDYILSRNTFVRTIPHSTVYTWALYAPAQFLIAYSTLPG